MGGGGNEGGGRPPPPSQTFQIDMNYEFSAPHYFDFIEGETAEEAHAAECWFKTAGTYAASPYVSKIKPRSSLAVDTLCSFQDAEKVEQMVARISPKISEDACTLASSTGECCPADGSMVNSNESNKSAAHIIHQELEVLTPRDTKKGIHVSSNDSKANSTGSKSSKQSNSSIIAKEVKSTKQSIARCIKSISSKKVNAAETSAIQENQAVKKQRLEAGRLRKILNIKEHILPHKVQSNLAVPKNLTTAMDKTKERKWNTTSKFAKLASPFVSIAEKVRSFQSRTSEQLLKQSASHDGSLLIPPQKPKVLTLTRPKEPEFETAQRVRPARVKSAAELEEEMLAKIPKFKARPLNKKILEAPSLPPLQKSAPPLPEFEEFHLKTMERALQHSGTSSSMNLTMIAEKQQHQSATSGGLTEPRPPHLETALRARPPKVKSSAELEQEELDKVPKFKARPFNPKIFCSKGDLGIFCNFKRQVTQPVEFHFATDERLPLPPPPTELFNKLSLNSLAQHIPLPQLTKPQPFRLLTEDRGAEKERKFLTELLEHEEREQEARIPKANPYPYTTDYPVIPPKPIRKECTKPEPFQLESLIRHEEELQRMMEEQARIEKEEAEMRKFRAQPVMSNDPVPVPERPRKPLTDVQEFTFHADIRAVERAEFDKKMKEKENQYKRFREEYEAAKMVEEERAVKMMRKMMVPHARPVPSFDKPFVPQRSSKELTKPKSPKLRVNRKYKRQSLTSSDQKKIQMR